MVDPNCGSPARQRVQHELTEEDEAVMQWYKKELAKAPQPPSWQPLRGSLLHTALDSKAQSNTPARIHVHSLSIISEPGARPWRNSCDLVRSWQFGPNGGGSVVAWGAPKMSPKARCSCPKSL